MGSAQWSISSSLLSPTALIGQCSGGVKTGQAYVVFPSTTLPAFPRLGVFLSVMRFVTSVTLNETSFCILALSALESIHSISRCSTGLLVLRTTYFCFPRAWLLLASFATSKFLYWKRQGKTGPYLLPPSHHDFVNCHHTPKFSPF